ncbi:protein HESO1-like isoform X2 [Ipomoea triloba]|uniref:protein HESO1-like isoform X2 n=1 Tax=Ipomoea triloba TaxID=35885 RepID=UPI00125D135B|nr:protein HESO1-like isoform X2 [Ipomoea triloba]
MVLRVKVLRKKSERLERKRLQKYVVISEKIPAIEDLFDSVYRALRPNPSDYELRRALVFVFNELAKDIYGPGSDAPVVEEFGSFVMDLFTAKSDLDLSVNFGNKGVEFTREKKIQRLRKFAKKLYALQRLGHVYGVHPITTANVPILKVVDRGTGIECDISVENRDGVSKSKIVHMICSIDERFGKLSFLMKAWAKAQNINSSKFKTLNSLSIILLVAFHLQTRNPPILPPFSALSEGAGPEVVAKSVLKFANYGKSNKESVAELFVTLLIKLLSVENLWCKGICASTYEGCWISKTWDFKVGCISVEDFTDRSQNVARAVGVKEVKKIYKCIHVSSQHISAFVEGRIEGSALKEYLFGRSGDSTLVDEGPKNKKRKNDGNGPKTEEVAAKASQQTNPLKPVLAVRNSAKEGWDASPSGNLVKSATKVWGGSPSGSWGKSVLDGWGGSPSGSWGKSTTDGWGGSPSGSLEKSAAKGWGGSPSRSWGKPAVDLWGESKVVGSKGWGGGSSSQSWGKPAVDLWGESKVVGSKGWGGGSPSRNWEKPAVDLWGGSRKSDHKPVSKKRKWSSGESQERTSTGRSGASSVNGCAGSQQTTSYNPKKKFKPFNNWRSKHAGGWDSTPQQPPAVGGGGDGWGKWGRG